MSGYYRILIRFQNQNYRFLGFEFRDDVDGTLIMVFDRKNSDPNVWSFSNKPDSGTPINGKWLDKFRMSYHPSGLVNYHGSSANPIFCEPIYDITIPQTIAWISIPSIGSLRQYNKESLTNNILELPSNPEERITFRLVMLPDSFEFDTAPLVLVNYSKIFSLAIYLDSFPLKIPDEFNDLVITAAPSRGQFDTQQISEEQAFSEFHHLDNPSPDNLCFWDKGVYRIILKSPMRVAPRLEVDFLDPSIEPEIFSVVKRRERVEIKFRARGKGGILNNFPCPIRGYLLDSRHYNGA